MSKELIRKAYELGLNAKGFEYNEPHKNEDLIAIIPPCEYGDEKTIMLRRIMYKAYIVGWQEANMKQACDDDFMEKVWREFNYE